MQSHVSAVPDFEGYVCYFGSLHPAFDMPCDIEYLKKQLLFLEQNRNFPKGRWVRSKNVFLSSAWRDSLVVNKKLCWELAEISLHEKLRVFWSNAESRFGCAIFRTLHSVLWLFTTCVWDVLRYRTLTKKQLWFFGNVVFVVLYCVQLFWWFSYKPSEKKWAISPKRIHQLSKMTLSTF